MSTRLALRFLAVAACMPSCQAVHQGQGLVARANPIRKVVTMLQTMQKKVAAEGEQEKELYEKFECYCKNSGAELGKTIADAETKLPQIESQIEEAASKKAQLDQDLVAHKADREAAKTSAAEAASIREKQAAAYAAEKAEYGANVDAINKAVAALEKGMTGGFLQTGAAQVLRKLSESAEEMMDVDRQLLVSFLSSEEGTDYAPQSGEITGMLKQLGESMAKGLAEATAQEEAAIAEYTELAAAKKKEVTALTTAIEEKSVRVGEVAVAAVEMKNDLADTEKGLENDKNFIAELEKGCDGKKAEWEEHQKTRSEELLALAETIKLLNDDDALDLFKKALPSKGESFMQLGTSMASLRVRALSAVRKAQRASRQARPALDFIALAIQGKKVGFEKVMEMVDAMVKTLKKEQQDDNSKKEYCGSEFDVADDKKKGLEQTVSDEEVALANTQETIATLVEEIKTLSAGIEELDKSVAEATEQRKEEHAAYMELMAMDSQAKELLALAKNRLNQFYNPALHVPPPKKELTEEERVYQSVAGSEEDSPALVQISEHFQEVVAPPPPPETFGAYSTKSQESTGVIAMIDMLVKDLDKEMTESETEEKNSQKEYEATMADSQKKRASDSTSLTDKEAAKADMEAQAETHKAGKASATAELSSTMEHIHALHGECDWLLQHFDVRKEARAGEVDALKQAKAALAGADYSFVQLGARNLRGRVA
eukprot:CAMPEP_0170637220 /NCGR_PEP_ID=MMETSP0224-20130122/38277_1 /TAXON_ID=285029 /ORGANISM="Togula jolla, Strain CCCM 725" /LENGTH=715 /DNA_ID=CAMNT_0010967049 /DNA_START=57 /DNA_END=2204 /DNA_ORIENTATION=+